MLVIVPLALVLAGVALLSVPVELAFHIRRTRRWQTRLAIGWMFGLVRFPVTQRKRKPEPRPEPRKKPHGFSPRWLGMMRHTAFRRRLARQLRRIMAAIRLRDLSLKIRLGLDDPAETGMLWAFLYPLAAYAGNRPNAVIDVAPVFAGETLAVDGRGLVRIVPAQLVWLIAAFVLSPSTLYALWKR